MKSSKTPSCDQLFFHFFRFCAIAINSSNDSCCGASMKMLPGRFIWCCIFAAYFTKRWSGIRNTWPSHVYLHFRMEYSRSYVLVRLLASACESLPVNRERHLALVPLSLAFVASVRFQASDPYFSRISEYCSGEQFIRARYITAIILHAHAVLVNRH